MRTSIQSCRAAICSHTPTLARIKSSESRIIIARVASVEQSSSNVDLGLSSSSRTFSPNNSLETTSASELELEELDGVQEQLLSWMMLDEEDQDNSLDEMIDWDEFGDEEYSEELKEEVESLIEAADVELKIGDRVTGLIYEVDEDGAYVEIGQKYSGFVPLSECSFARLKTVSACSL